MNFDTYRIELTKIKNFKTYHILFLYTVNSCRIKRISSSKNVFQCLMFVFIDVGNGVEKRWSEY